MAAPNSPLVGYNNNVRHKGKVYHIQTEDSGIQHPHVITHLFADGGRIVASKKTSYATYVGTADCQVHVKELMREQHKAMFMALRDCVYDEGENAVAQMQSAATTVEAQPETQPKEMLPPVPVHAEAVKSRYASTLPSKLHQANDEQRKKHHSNAPLFGAELLSEKSLDEVILSYLAEEVEEGDAT